MNFLALLLFATSFVTVVVLIANKKNFGMAMLIGSAILAISIPDKIFNVLASTILDFKVIALMIIVVLIKLLATILEEGGEIQQLIAFMEGKMSSQGMLVAIPSILGLLPVPGGALLSAPIVKKKGDEIGMDNETQMALNLWYRHIGFMVYPLSTTLILLSGLSGINVYTLIILQFPIFIMSFLVGFYFVYGYKGIKEESKKGSVLPFLPILLPVVIAIALSIVLSSIFTKSMATYISYLIAIPAGIILAIKIASKKIEYRKGLSISLAIAIFGIMLFKNIINATGITSQISSYLNFLPPIILIPLVSFGIGILTAHNMAAVAILYPMFSSMMNIHLVIIMFISSFFGYLISPLHLCIAVTYDYFRPKFGKFYKKILPPSIAVMIIVVLLYGLI